MSGGGTVTPITSVPFEDGEVIGEALPRSCVSLARYARIVQVKECAFWGVNYSDDPEPGCRSIWTNDMRDWLARYLAEAQEEIEQQVNFPLCPTYFTDERHDWAYPVQTRWGKVIAAGVRAVATVQAGAVVNHGYDPAIIGPIATALTDTSEIKVFYPGSDREIEPKRITISGGYLTIWIPRCRLVRPDYMNNPENGLAYEDTANFLATVDIKRVYTDGSTHATLVWPHQCSSGGGGCACGEYTRSGCMYIRHNEVGSIDVMPATYSSGSWVKSSCPSGKPDIVRLNYLAGLSQITRQIEDTVIRLAHAKMPSDFCSRCDTWTRFHRRDTNIPSVLTRERLNCPFGLSDGAWTAWRFTQSFRLVRGYTF